MRKIKLLLLVTLLAANISFCQTEANKLRSQIAAATGTKKVDLLLKANPGIFNWKGKVVDSTYYYAKLFYDEGKRIGYLQVSGTKVNFKICYRELVGELQLMEAFKTSR